MIVDGGFLCHDVLFPDEYRAFATVVSDSLMDRGLPKELVAIVLCGYRPFKSPPRRCLFTKNDEKPQTLQRLHGASLKHWQNVWGHRASNQMEHTPDIFKLPFTDHNWDAWSNGHRAIFHVTYRKTSMIVCCSEIDGTEIGKFEHPYAKPSVPWETAAINRNRTMCVVFEGYEDACCAIVYVRVPSDTAKESAAWTKRQTFALSPGLWHDVLGFIGDSNICVIVYQSHISLVDVSKGEAILFAIPGEDMSVGPANVTLSGNRFIKIENPVHGKTRMYDPLRHMSPLALPGDDRIPSEGKRDSHKFFFAGDDSNLLIVQHRRRGFGFTVYDVCFSTRHEKEENHEGKNLERCV